MKTLRFLSGSGAVAAAVFLSIACSSSSPATPAAGTCENSGGPVTGAADTHCIGQPVQPTSAASCGISDAGVSNSDAGAPADAGPQPTPGACGENGPDYGATMFGTTGDDDDCKYHVTWSVSPVCSSENVYFTVVATNLTDNSPLTGAYPFAELCLSDTHPAPTIDSEVPDGKQTVVEGPPGTYKVGPVQFDASGQWTVRFHFNEKCFDVVPDSPHGHAAFFVSVP